MEDARWFVGDISRMNSTAITNESKLMCRIGCCPGIWQLLSMCLLG